MERLTDMIVSLCARLWLLPASCKRRDGQLNVSLSPAAAAVKDGERRGAGDDSEARGEHSANTGSR